MTHPRKPIDLVRGKVSFLKPEENYGFIQILGSKEEVFFHRRACGDPYTLEDFRLGDRVVFQMLRVKVHVEKKLRGFEVKLMDPRDPMKKGKTR